MIVSEADIRKGSEFKDEVVKQFRINNYPIKTSELISNFLNSSGVFHFDELAEFCSDIFNIVS